MTPSTSPPTLARMAGPAARHRRAAARRAVLAALALCTAGCANRPQAPMLALPADPVAAAAMAAKLDALMPADVLLVGEQHDAPGHQQAEQQIVASLAA